MNVQRCHLLPQQTQVNSYIYLLLLQRLMYVFFSSDMPKEPMQLFLHQG